MIIKVGMGDYKVTKRPEDLTTLGLGSCVGICIYDNSSGIIGMAHIMLPSIAQSRDINNIAKFADTAIPGMINDMVALGAKKSHLIAKIAGGAQMFSFSKESDIMKIGPRNVSKTKEILSELNIPIIAEDTGGNSGRTIVFQSEDGNLLIKVASKEVKVL
jgi:chemotaxis protein CheD